MFLGKDPWDPITSEAPVDRFSQRPDQTPWLGSEPQGVADRDLIVPPMAQNRMCLKSEKRYKNLHSHFESLSGPPFPKLRWLSSGAVPETQRAIDGQSSHTRH